VFAGLEAGSVPRKVERWNILDFFTRDQAKRGDGGFWRGAQIDQIRLRKEEWWQIEMQHRTRSAKLAVLFPKRRHRNESGRDRT